MLRTIGSEGGTTPWNNRPARGKFKRIRVLLADDHPGFPQLVEGALSNNFEVVGKVSDGRSLVEASSRLNPDVIITDISMPILNGLDAVEELRQSGCKSKIIFLTVHADADFVRRCLALGAGGYVVKSRLATDLLPAIEQALAGQVFVSPQLRNDL